jgi:hypothetical protein
MKKLFLWIFFLSSGLGSCSKLPQESPGPLTPTTPEGTLVIRYQAYGTSFTKTQKNTIENYAKPIRRIIPAGESWILLANSYSDEEWLKAFGNYCSGSGLLKSKGGILIDRFYDAHIWIGISLESNRCLKAFQAYNDLKPVISDYESLFNEEIKYHFFEIYRQLNLTWTGSVPVSYQLHNKVTNPLICLNYCFNKS